MPQQQENSERYGYGPVPHHGSKTLHVSHRRLISSPIRRGFGILRRGVVWDLSHVEQHLLGDNGVTRFVVHKADFAESAAFLIAPPLYAVSMSELASSGTGARSFHTAAGGTLLFFLMADSALTRGEMGVAVAIRRVFLGFVVDHQRHLSFSETHPPMVSIKRWRWERRGAATYVDDDS